MTGVQTCALPICRCGAEDGIRKTVARRINNRHTVRQNWEKQMHQLGMAGHLLFIALLLSSAGAFEKLKVL